MTGMVAVISGRLNWELHAACRGDAVDGTLFFTGASVLEAKGICAGCRVRDECLAEAMDAERGLGVVMRAGVWGGKSPTERCALDPVVRARREARAQQHAGGETRVGDQPP